MINKRWMKAVMIVLSVSFVSAVWAAPTKMNKGSITIPHKFWPSS